MDPLKAVEAVSKGNGDHFCRFFTGWAAIRLAGGRYFARAKIVEEFRFIGIAEHFQCRFIAVNEAAIFEYENWIAHAFKDTAIQFCVVKWR
jgi:hypothetical protein